MDPSYSTVPDTTQIKKPCILPSSQNKLPDVCIGGGLAACPAHGVGPRIWDPTAFQTPFNCSSLYQYSLYSSVPTFKEFHQFLKVLMNLKLVFPTVGVRFGFLGFVNLITTGLFVFLSPKFCLYSFLLHHCRFMFYTIILIDIVVRLRRDVSNAPSHLEAITFSLPSLCLER